MPIEYVRRIPTERFGYEEWRATAEEPDDLAVSILAIDKMVNERPTPMQVFTGRPDNGTVDGYEYEDQDNIPFDDVPHPADSSAEFNKLKQRRQQGNQRARAQGKRCGFCGGDTWNNIEKKKNGDFSETAPDFTCKDKDECGAVMWLRKDGTDGEWKEPRR